MPFPTYGQLQLQGYSETPDSAVLRTDMETGPAKQAKIRSRSLVKRAVSIFYTGAEFETFKTWFRGAECNHGASWFDWVDPQTGNTVQARIVSGDYAARASSEGDGARMGWDVSMTLETWE